MPLIYYSASNYKNNYQQINTNGEQSIRCRKRDLYRCIITVGNPSFISWNSIRTLGFARAIYNSIIEKISLIAVNIESDLNGMRLHQIYDTYVSDQKRIVSYNMGMAFAKYYSEKLLDIPHLIHVETLKKQKAITFSRIDGESKREPDLVGRSTDGNWHVFEAKGTTQNQLDSKLSEAKEQVEQVDTIHNQTPATFNACATNIGYDRVFSLIEDPESKKNKKAEINIEKYVDAYYSFFTSLENILDKRSQIRQMDGFRYYASDIEAKGLQLTIGLEEETYSLLKEKSPSRLFEGLSKMKDFIGGLSEEASIGLDGFLVKYKRDE